VEAGVEPSVGSIGDSYDNALAETINGLYKAEIIHRRGPWRSLEAVEFATLEWVDWPRNAITPCWNTLPWRRDSNQMASDEPGAVHRPQCVERLRASLARDLELLGKPPIRKCDPPHVRPTPIRHTKCTQTEDCKQNMQCC
jgi:hypothetical protein